MYMENLDKILWATFTLIVIGLAVYGNGPTHVNMIFTDCNGRVLNVGSYPDIKPQEVLDKLDNIEFIELTIEHGKSYHIVVTDFAFFVYRGTVDSTSNSNPIHSSEDVNKCVKYCIKNNRKVQ